MQRSETLIKKHRMPYKHDIIGIFKGLFIGGGGLAAIQLPNWISELSMAMYGFEGFYKMIIALLTICLLILQINKIRKEKP